MLLDLLATLPLILPKAIEWAEAQSSFVCETGQPLNEKLLAVARRVGVVQPERIRIAEVDHLPLPEDLELRNAAFATGLFSSNTVGLTLGHGVYVCHGHHNIRLLSHEFRHVYQYEQAGSIAEFLSIYLQQLVTVGYDHATYELDAQAHECLNA